MIKVTTNQDIRLKLTILKAGSSHLEDFSRSRLTVFVVTPSDKYPAEYSIDGDGAISVRLGVLHELGIHSIKAVWIKNESRHRMNAGKCICHAEVQNAYGVTDLVSEASDPSLRKVVINTKTYCTTYGHDGLDAYELGVLRGTWTGSESAFLGSKYGKKISTDDIADGAITEAKLSEALRKKIREGSTGDYEPGDGYMIYTDTDCPGFLMLNQTAHYKFAVWDGFAHEVNTTGKTIEWSIKRHADSFSSADVDPWNYSDKARSFNGEIDLKWSAQEQDNDLDPNEENGATKFEIKAVITDLDSEESISLTSEISI